MTMKILQTSGPNDTTVNHLNSLLKGEISATETYRMAIDKAAGKETPEHTDLLQKFQEEHAASASHLRQCIADLGGEASDTSGAWAKTVQGTMNIFGAVSALKAIREGEEHGLNDYEAAAAEVDTRSRQLIEEQLIPTIKNHLAALDRLIDEAGKRK